MVERGWTPAEFTADRLALTAAVLADAPPSGSDPTAAANA